MLADPTETLLRRRDVERITALSRSTIYSRMQQGTFPEPIRIGGRAVRWRQSDVNHWLQQHGAGGAE